MRSSRWNPKTAAKMLMHHDRLYNVDATRPTLCCRKQYRKTKNLNATSQMHSSHNNKLMNEEKRTWNPMKFAELDGLIRVRSNMYLQKRDWAVDDNTACATCLPCRMSIIRNRQFAKMECQIIGTTRVKMTMAQKAEIWMILNTRSNSLESDDRRLATEGKSLRSRCILVNNLVNCTITCTNESNYNWTPQVHQGKAVMDILGRWTLLQSLSLAAK